VTIWRDLGASKHVMLTSYKKDGTPVGLPMWFAYDGDRVVMWTNPNSWKVKRIRRNPSVLLQICDSKGNRTTGYAVVGHAEIQDAAGTERTRAAVARKYGLIGIVSVYSHKLVRGKDATIGISIAEKARD
jgi:PPOX class probable F420-dependent enzyme